MKSNLEQLRSRKGELVLLKHDLYWGGSEFSDGKRDRICVLLDAADTEDLALSGHPGPDARTFLAVAAERYAPGTDFAAHLMIDGIPSWIWVAQGDVELVDTTACNPTATVV